MTGQQYYELKPSFYMQQVGQQRRFALFFLPAADVVR